MKLKIIPPAKHIPNKIKLPEKTGFESPVGWWDVTTEGDCEGRRTTKLGQHYGHVAEIAFYLANKSYYGLHFSPITEKLKKPSKRMHYMASGTTVNVQLNIDSGTWSMDKLYRTAWMRGWLDANEDIKVSDSNYYACTKIELLEK